MPPRHPARTLNARRAFSVSNITRPAATDSVRFVLGIRAEDPKRLWERRAPLLPAECATLLADASLRPLRILVQPSERRCVPDAAYRAVGVEVNEDLTECDAIVGVKEVPAEAILRDARSEERSYVVFNHVHKAQAYNMPLLASMLDSGSRFIDWELITSEKGDRATAFGTLAGVAGMADGLSLLGMRCLALGISSPFLVRRTPQSGDYISISAQYLPRPFVHPSTEAFNESLRELGRQIAKDGTPSGLGAFTVAIVGTGRVGKGAKQVLDETSVVRWIQPDELRVIAEDPNRHVIYAAQISSGDHLVRKDGRAFSRDDLKRRPGDYASRFADEIAPFCTMVVNGSFWAPGSPRLLTTEQHSQLRQRLHREGVERKRMLSIVDVSCDFEGGLEFVKRATTIEDPVFYLDDHGREHADFAHPNSTQVCTIEILPTELPHAASEHFSTSALPFYRALIAPRLADPAHHAALERATLLSQGKLRPKHDWLTAHLPKASSATMSQKKRVLLLGSGLVAGPAVDTFLARPDIRLTIASGEPKAAVWLAAGKADVVTLDLADASKTAALVAAHDLVVSLLPAPLHPLIARTCVREGKHLVTASYAGDEMRQLNDEAASRDLVFLNELGLDPGLDHLGAMHMIDRARRQGNEITAFTSFCGGLPAPEASDVPLSYKFSWAPRGMLTAASNPASFRLAGRDHAIAGEDLLRQAFPSVPVVPSLRLEGLANRNSLDYLAAYGLDASLPTVLRGTLRYAGTARLLNALRLVGLLDPAPLPVPVVSWWDFLQTVLHRQTGRDTSSEGAVLGLLDDLLAGQSGCASAEETAIALQQLGAWPSSTPHPDLPPPPSRALSALDAFAQLLQHALRYRPGERDMVILSHELGVRSQGQDVVEAATLIATGDPHEPSNRSAHSAMAKTVGWPIALGALHVLDGGVTERGVLLPTGREVYEVLLPQLEALGVRFSEKRRCGTVWVPQL